MSVVEKKRPNERIPFRVRIWLVMGWLWDLMLALPDWLVRSAFMICAFVFLVVGSMPFLDFLHHLVGPKVWHEWTIALPRIWHEWTITLKWVVRTAALLLVGGFVRFFTFSRPKGRPPGDIGDPSRERLRAWYESYGFGLMFLVGILFFVFDPLAHRLLGEDTRETKDLPDALLFILFVLGMLGMLWWSFGKLIDLIERRLQAAGCRIIEQQRRKPLMAGGTNGGCGRIASPARMASVMSVVSINVEDDLRGRGHAVSV